MAKAPSAVFVYLRKEGLNSLISEQVNHFASPPKVRKMDPREYGIGAQILRALGVGKINIVAKTKPEIIGLEGFDLEIVDVTNPVDPMHDSSGDDPSEIIFN